MVCPDPSAWRECQQSTGPADGLSQVGAPTRLKMVPVFLGGQQCATTFNLSYGQSRVSWSTPELFLSSSASVHLEEHTDSGVCFPH